MAQTIADITVTTAWQSINTLSSISVGTEIIVDNKTIAVVLMSEGTQPSADSKQGVPLTTYADNLSSRTIKSGSLEVWIRVESDTGTARIVAQEG
tara:strand:- start:1338 stop:1622 length:285 start_codon:yes stop_codon:yes gene_type:complete